MSQPGWWGLAFSAEFPNGLFDDKDIVFEATDGGALRGPAGEGDLFDVEPALVTRTEDLAGAEQRDEPVPWGGAEDLLGFDSHDVRPVAIEAWHPSCMRMEPLQCGHHFAVTW